MPVRSICNQYPGINAHLHSRLQTSGGWNSFHSSHIIHLTSSFKRELRPLGYTADVEQSLQIRRADEPPHDPESDVLIYDEDPVRPLHSWQHVAGDTHELVAPIPEALNLREEQVRYHKAIGIYRTVATKQNRGEPVAWVELLSPSNKPGGQDASYYDDKRSSVLQSGLVFVEIDYLHQSPSTFANLANYHPKGHKPVPETGSHAYRIAVVDPRPEFLEGQARIRQFDVDEAIPTVTIPLNAGDALAFDFNKPYQKTFEEMLYGDDVDYEELPERFELYSEHDRARIVSRMIAVLHQKQHSENLEECPLPVVYFDLETALRKISLLRK